MNSYTCKKKTPIVTIIFLFFSFPSTGPPVLGTSIFPLEVVHAPGSEKFHTNITMFLARQPNVRKELVQMYRKINLLQQMGVIK